MIQKVIIKNSTKTIHPKNCEIQIEDSHTYIAELVNKMQKKGLQKNEIPQNVGGID